MRLRSLPLKEGLKMPRKAAIASGNIDVDRASAHAYIVFESRNSAVYALQLNMSEVSHILICVWAQSRLMVQLCCVHIMHYTVLQVQDGPLMQAHQGE